MKYLLAGLALLLGPSAHAASIWITGAKAEGIVKPLVDMGMDPLGTHEFFQAGVVGCVELFDTQGGYFPGGKIGDYMGESCLLYGSSFEADMNGRWEPEVILPADDRELKNHPELAARLAKLRAIRLGLEALVVPIVRTIPSEGKEVVIARTSGFAGIACDGRNQRGERVCQVLLSPKFPAR